ncbi:hypothetical protein PGTUg99_014108 [Puccinia graminis f. sp. tritici]|uniref:Uncharacterized protein n=1 Tax=Puccinia graminis f. sp. tritici TaxID=56615 RepID=A0A5B0MZE9_PUCGR|nr:hypothetical protein PGTUg99_014108 [Puccinia graminis f. sp. tritici]
MQSSNLLSILTVLLIHGGVNYVESFGCEHAEEFSRAGCVRVWPQRSPSGPGEPPRPYWVNMMVAPWDNYAKTYDCRKAPGWTRTTCCISDDDMAGNTTVGIWYSSCREINGDRVNMPT